MNPSSYKYLDQAPISLFFSVVCSSTKLSQSDVLGAVMAVHPTHFLAGIPNLLATKNLGRIKIIEIESEINKEIKKFNLEIPLKSDPAIWSILAADVEQINFVGSSKAKFTLTEVNHNSNQRESLVLTRANEIISRYSSQEHNKGNNPVLEFFSKLGFNPSNEQTLEKVYPIDKKSGIFGSSSSLDGGSIILVEGVSDIRTLVRAGYKYVISVNGYTISESLDQLNKLVIDKEVTIFMDGDKGGTKILELLKEKLKPKILKTVEEKNYGEVQLLTKLQIDSLLSRRKFQR